LKENVDIQKVQVSMDLTRTLVYIYIHTHICLWQAKFNICDTIKLKSAHLENFCKIKYIAFSLAQFILSLGCLYQES